MVLEWLYPEEASSTAFNLLYQALRAIWDSTFDMPRQIDEVVLMGERLQQPFTEQQAVECITPEITSLLAIHDQSARGRQMVIRFRHAADQNTKICSRGSRGACLPIVV